ncbi:HlyD family secretion protein [Dyella sedimenti]|uniref:HlyD family secretion protein n=1 Tax=Dyella sedimenti TaxID=2919947 RepID=UPI001FAA31C9|nr:efflux RND transporter periplasmic adaptor subunit [Dyella sedimenti]
MAISPVLKKRLLLVAGLVVIVLLGTFAWQKWGQSGPGEGFISGNGRIEATEIDVAAKMPGRVQDILVREGDFVSAGQTLARMQVDVLQAQRAEAVAGEQQARHQVAAGEAQVALRQSDVAAAQAQVTQHESELANAQRRLARSQTLAKEGASSEQELDDDRARVSGMQATVAAAKARLASANAAVEATKAQLVGLRSSVEAARATIARVDADIADSDLKSPRDGRVQYRVSQPGEVLGAGGKVLNLLDLSDVYMTFFLPETVAGKVAMGSEVHIVLDAIPQWVIPAKVSFVASAAQFTPKTVETASERQKLMFRVRAQIPPALLRKHLEQVKTGVPGVAWVKLDPDKDWPPQLAVKLPE